MRFWRKSLLARLLAAFLALAVISLAVVGAISYQQGRRALQESILDHLDTTATLKSQEIERWVSSLTEDVGLISQNAIVAVHAQKVVEQDVPGATSMVSYNALRDYLDGVVADKPDFLEIMVLKSTGGKILLSTNPAHEGKYEVTSSFFVEGRKGTYVQNVYPSASLGALAMTISTPLQDVNGQTFGVLAAHLNLTRLDDIMKERTGLGTTGETYLVDQYNTFVSAARGGGEEFPRGVHTAGIDSAVRDKTDGRGLYDNYRAVPVLGAYRWLPSRDMALLAEIELSEALQPTRQLARSVLAIGLLVSVLVIVVAYTLARQITRPIRALTETSTRMASGNLDLSVEVYSQDEIGILARAFNSMAAQLRSLVHGLERRVAERTEQLEQRAVQLATAADVGRVATAILEPHALAQQTVDLLRERFGLYYAGLFLVDEAGRYAVLEAGTGEAGRIMREAGHKLEVGGTSMVGAACAMRQARIALDVGSEAIRFDNPLLPETRSEMAVPLLVADHVLGALDVQSTEMAAFSDEEIEVLQLACNQVAVAIDNARKFSSEAALLEATSPMVRVSSRLSAAVDVNQVVQVITQSVAETEADSCLVGRLSFDSAGEVVALVFMAHWQRVPGPQVPLGQPLPATRAMLPLPLLTTFWTDEDVFRDARLPASSQQMMAGLGVRALANIPLQSGGRTVGFILVARAVPGTLSGVSMRLYETLAGQAAVALERARLLDEAQQRAEREKAIRDVSERVFTSLDLNTLLETTLADIGKLVGGAGGYVELGVKE